MPPPRSDNHPFALSPPPSSSALGEVFKLVGALDLFGDTVRLVQSFSLGMWHLIAMPAEGVARGSVAHFLAGIGRGVSSMVSVMSNAYLAMRTSLLRVMTKAESVHSYDEYSPVVHESSSSLVYIHPLAFLIVRNRW